MCDVMDYRTRCGLSIPDPWHQNRISWLVVQDYNASGLSGDLRQRTSDFWNYWLNFGQSNKTDGSVRGGRGIGRVTFLIASQIQTVIGYTRRVMDRKSHICGMAVLKPIETGSDFHATHAYLAKSAHHSIYHLHSEPEFQKMVIEGLRFNDYRAINDTGLALAIPYPHRELKKASILAASIENFAPTILDGTLQLNVDDIALNRNSIRTVIDNVKAEIRDPSIKDDPQRYLDLLERNSTNLPTYRIQITDPTNVRDAVGPVLSKVSNKIERNRSCRLDILIPLKRANSVSNSILHALVARTPKDKLSLDRFFRGGMCLPKVRTQKPKDFDLLFFANENQISRYLNLCEGRAHLDLLESKSISEQLRRHSYSTPIYGVKRVVKSLPTMIRQGLYGDTTKPDLAVLDRFFSVSMASVGPGAPRQPDAVPTFKRKAPTPFKVSTLKDGVRIRANTQFRKWPVRLRARFAYADGRRSPAWSREDFLLANLAIIHRSCDEPIVKENVISAGNCISSLSIDVTGFDANRELVVFLYED